MPGSTAPPDPAAAPAAAPAAVAEALGHLARADDQLARAGIVRRSLGPGRESATSLLGLGQALRPLVPHGCEIAFGSGLAAVALAELRNFPSNIFWDFAYTAASLLRDAARAADPAQHLTRACESIVALQDLFGGGTEIRFCYGHDFIYGFDWAKWVRKAPSQRAQIGPFDLVFLEYLLGRGEELLALIDADDVKYPRLLDERPRNPFTFSREPEAEAALHLRLAAEHKLPVESWLIDAAPVWDRPFQRLRTECAETLGLTRASA